MHAPLPTFSHASASQACLDGPTPSECSMHAPSAGRLRCCAPRSSQCLSTRKGHTKSPPSGPERVYRFFPVRGCPHSRGLSDCRPPYQHAGKAYVCPNHHACMHAGLLTKREASGDQTTLEATLMAQLDANQRETLRRLQREASLSWWQPGHPGWAIWPVDSDGFMKGAQAQVEALLREAQLDVAHQHAAVVAQQAGPAAVAAAAAAAAAAASAAAAAPVPEADGFGGEPTGALGGGNIPPVVVKGADVGRGREGFAH